MKKTIKSVLAVLMVSLMCMVLISCDNVNERSNASLWDNAIYTEDTEFGVGSKTVRVEVKAEEKSVIFTVNTDKETVGEALKEHDLISGEEGAYGIYIKSVNGITADYNADKSYWAFEKNGEQMMTGVDSAEFSSGDSFELVYAK